MVFWLAAGKLLCPGGQRVVRTFIERDGATGSLGSLAFAHFERFIHKVDLSPFQQP